MDESYTGGDVIVQALKAAGVEYVFGIISIHNIPVYDAIARQGGIRPITNRSEPGAVNMADGYAKAGGRLGVVITSTGAGAGNAAGALIEAQTHGTPLLHLTGQIDSPYLDQGKGFIHECKDQLGMLKAISKDAFRVRAIRSLAATIQHAIELAQAAPTGVVSVEIPIDLQKMLLSAPELRFNFQARLAPDPSCVKEAADILLSAKRPLSWSGNDVIQANAAGELTHLAEMWGAGVLTSQAGRGAIPEDHPHCIGNFAYNSAIRDFIGSCDVLLAVGTRFRGAETMVWRLPLPKTIVQIDVDQLAISRNYQATLGCVTDAKMGLQALIQELEGSVQPDPDYLEEVVTARNTCRNALRATLGPHEQLCDDLLACMERDAVLAADVTISVTTWGARLFPVYGPHQYIHAAGGGIGQGLQMGLGAKIGQPERQVVVMVGDGGLQVNIGELGTAVQEEIAVVIVLFNDSGYGVLRNIQNRAYGGRHIGVDLHGLNFEKLCEAYGIHYYPVTRVEAFRPAIESALASGRLSLVEIDIGAVGPFGVPFQLSERGLKVAVLEAQISPAMGSTGRSTAGVRVQFTEEVNIRLSWESIQEYQHFQDLYGEDAGYRPIGYLLLVPPERLVVHMASVRLQERLGVPVRVFSVEDAQQLVRFDPANIAVNAAGAWAGEVARRAGLTVPVQPVRRIVYATVPTAWHHTYPLTIDLASGFYLRSEGNRILVGRSNPDEPPGFTEGVDWDWFEPTIRVGSRRFPWLAEVGLDHRACWWGYYEVTPDHNPILGRLPTADTWINVAGFSGHGVQQAPMVGRLIAEEITLGKAQAVNIDPLKNRPSLQSPTV